MFLFTLAKRFCALRVHPYITYSLKREGGCILCTYGVQTGGVEYAFLAYVLYG